MSRLALVALLASAAACGGPAPGDDDGGNPDAAMAGLVIHISSPDLGQSDQGTTVSQVKMHLHDVRALGDAANGSNTYLARSDVDLTPGTVSTISFTQAPPGRYSSLDFALEAAQDGDYAWRMSASVVVGGVPKEVEIENDQTQSITLPFDVQLDAAQVVTLEVHLTVLPILAPIDWSQVPSSGDSIELQDSSPELVGLRTRFAAAFSIAVP